MRLAADSQDTKRIWVLSRGMPWAATASTNTEAVRRNREAKVRCDTIRGLPGEHDGTRAPTDLRLLLADLKFVIALWPTKSIKIF